MDTLVSLAIQLLIAAFLSIGWIKFFRLKEARLFKNIRRPIAIISTDTRSMQHETELLRNSGLFSNVGNPTSDGRAIDYLRGKRLLVLGYSKSIENLADIVNAARTHNIPMIVYAAPGEIEEKHLKILQAYTYYTMCNTPLRLVSDVFAIMSTFPEKM